MDYVSAVIELYQAAHEEFGATRKRLAAVLAGKGDTAGAAALAKLARPTLSAWVVNQLWWADRKTFERMLETGGRLHDGHTGAGPMYGKAVEKLRARAEALLGATDDPDATMRSVMTTLAALTAAGGFGAERPGTLTVDREPGGFEALGEVTVRADRAPSRADAVDDVDDADDAPAPPPLPLIPPPKPPAITKHANGRVHPHVEFHTEDDAHTLQLSERNLLEGALRTAQQTIAMNEPKAKRLRSQLEELDRSIAHARSIVADVEARLDETADDRPDADD